MLTYDKVKNLLLDELRAKGYSPNPSDVHPAALKIMELSTSKEVKEGDEEPVKPSKPSKS